VVDGSIYPGVGNAACNAGGKFLKVVEMQHEYGSTKSQGEAKDLALVPPDPELLANARPQMAPPIAPEDAA
jgi:hypothetical protein